MTDCARLLNEAGREAVLRDEVITFKHIFSFMHLNFLVIVYVVRNKLHLISSDNFIRHFISVNVYRQAQLFSWYVK